MKIEDALIHSYSMLVMRGRCKITDIPETYRSEVRDYISIDMIEEPKDDVEFVIDDKGPMTLPKLEFTIKSGDTISVKESEIFTPDVLNGQETPEVLKYEIVRNEPQVAFELENPVSSTVTKTLKGFNLRVSGTPRVQIAGMPSLSIVVKVITRNYEPMNLTLYVTVKK